MLKKFILIFVLSFLLTSCASVKQPRLATSFALSGLSADVYSTAVKLNEGCEEQNPLYGNLNAEGIAIVNIAIGSFLWYFQDHIPDTAMWTVGAIRWTVAGINMSQSCNDN